ncbi:MAG TPA: YfbM family protein [Gaiellaceae bacterium]|jgi:hypothetical protein
MSMIGNLRLVSDPELEDLFAGPEQIEDVLYESDEPSPDEEVIDKAWHGLHYLLTGSAWDGDPPLNFLVSGGREIGDVDVGYGPARGFTSAEVAEISEALKQVTSDQLRSRFDAKLMMEAQIYPEIWDRDPAEDDALGYLLEYFELLKTFVLRAHDESSGLIVYLN